MSRPPRFVWHDLMTSDPAGAQRFYTQLFGWKTRGSPASNERYIHIRAGETDIGGMVLLEQKGVPPHWIGYVSVDDVDQTAKRVERAGGGVIVGPSDIQNVGRYAVIRDPLGAYLALFKSSHGDTPEPDGPPAEGTFIWNELLTSDPAKAGAFYGEVFGWKAQSVDPKAQAADMRALGTYWLLKRGVSDAGGMMQLPPGADSPPCWVGYVASKDVDAAAARLVMLGGMLHLPPTDIPGVGRMCVAADPQAATFAIYKPLAKP